VILETCHHQLIHHNLNLNQGLKRASQKLGVWVILLLYEVQRRELSTTVMSKKWRGFVYCQFHHQWTDKSWYLLHLCVFSKQTSLEIYVAVVLSLFELSSLFYSRPHLYPYFIFLFWLYVHPLMGYDWLFCCVWVIHVTLSLFTEMWPSECGLSIHSILSSLFSLFYFTFQAVFSAVVVDTNTNSTYWTNSIERNFVS
jgi:hypothetical protein